MHGGHSAEALELALSNLLRLCRQTRRLQLPLQLRELRLLAVVSAAAASRHSKHAAGHPEARRHAGEGRAAVDTEVDGRP